MVCDDFHRDLKVWLARYEQACIVADEAVADRVDLPGLPMLRLKTCEADKSIETVQRIWDFLLAQQMTRSSLLIAVGGGVLTDMAGFAAATYKRGIAYINVPTTLLSMVDASSGGKTGFNYGGLKNCIGVFAPPVETLICPAWLTSLPPQQILSGFGEMLKTGLIVESQNGTEPVESLWAQLLRYDLDTMPLETLTPLINTCVRAKEAIVAADPQETGLRKVLNFGHTFGHALEEIQMVNGKWSNGKWPHGYAVVYGMMAELYLSVVKLGCPRAPLQQLTQVMLHAYGKPQCKCSDFERLIILMQQDKKNERATEINCTLLEDVGKPIINQVITPDEAREAWDYLFSL